MVNGILYFTSPNHVWAADARTGRELWHYQYPANTGSTIGATINNAITTQKPIQKIALWLSLRFAGAIGLSSGAVVISVSAQTGPWA